MTTLREVLEKGAQYFKERDITQTARLDADLVVGHALGLQRIELYLKYEQPLEEWELLKCRENVRRRAAGEPVAYIVGKKFFYEQTFLVGPGVLIPRPETELIVDQALKYLREKRESICANADFDTNEDANNTTILDLGTGTGCILLSILKIDKKTNGIAVEKSSEAAKYFTMNVKMLGLENRAELLLSPVMEVLRTNDSLDSRFDVITANPPYIDSQSEALSSQVKAFEPAEALFAGQGGLANFIEWIPLSAKLLKSGGCLLFEIGFDQGRAVRDILKRESSLTAVEILKDIAGLDRVARAMKR